MAVNSFVVEPRFGRMPDAALVRSDLARALDGELAAGRPAAREGAGLLPPRRPTPRAAAHRCSGSTTATDATVVEIRGEDEIGLLYRITAALERAGARRPLGAGLVARPGRWSTRST